jgi:hypothetical protein
MGVGCASSGSGRNPAAVMADDGNSGGLTEADGSLNLRALRSVASVKTQVSPGTAIEPRNVQKLLEAYGSAFSSEVQVSSQNKSEGLNVSVRYLGAASGEPGEASIPRCSVNEDGSAPARLNVSFKGDFLEKRVGEFSYVTFEEKGKVNGGDGVVKSMNLQFVIKPDGEKKLVGLDLFDISAGFKGDFNPFWSGKSVLCSIDPNEAKKPSPSVAPQTSAKAGAPSQSRAPSESTDN